MAEILQFGTRKPEVETPKPLEAWTVTDWRYYFCYMSEMYGENEAWDLLYGRIQEFRKIV